MQQRIMFLIIRIKFLVIYQNLPSVQFLATLSLLSLKMLPVLEKQEQE